MKLQRQHAKDPATGVMSCTHVKIIHTGISPEQNFSHRLIEQGMAEGWVHIKGDRLVMEAEPENMVYAIKRTPGYFCKSSGARIPISELAWTRFRATGVGDMSRKEAQAWLATNGKKADDYEVTQAYECALEKGLHAKYRGVRAVSGNVVAANSLEA